MDLAVLNLKVNSSSVNRASRDLDRLTRSTGSMSSAARIFRRAILAATTALVAFGTAAVAQFAKIEKTEITLRTLIGDAEKTKEIMDDLRAIVARTPLAFDGLAAGLAQLKAFGTKTKDLIPDLLTLSDAAIALGGNKAAESLARFIRTLGEIRSQGRLDNEDLRRLAELKIPNLLPELARMFGTETTGEFRKAVERWRVDSEDAIRAVFDILRRRTGGLAQAVAQTTVGAFDILKNNVFLELEKIGSTLNEAFDITGNLQRVVPLVREYGNILRQALSVLTGRGVTGELDQRALDLADAVRTLGQVVKFLVTLQLASWALGAARSLKLMGAAALAHPYIALVAAIATLLPQIKQLADESNKLAIAQRAVDVQGMSRISREDIFNNRRTFAVRQAEQDIERLKDALVGPDGLTDAGQRVLKAMRDLRTVRFPDLTKDLIGAGTPEERGTEAFQRLEVAKATVERLLGELGALQLPALSTDEGQDEADEFNLRKAKQNFQKLLDIRADAAHKLSTSGKSELDQQLADADRFWDELRGKWEDNANALRLIADGLADDRLRLELEAGDKLLQEASELTGRRLEEAHEAVVSLLREQRAAVHDARTVGLDAQAKELADLLHHQEGMRTEWAGNGAVILQIDATFRDKRIAAVKTAHQRELDAAQDAAERLAEQQKAAEERRIVEAQRDRARARGALAELGQNAQFERELIGLSNEGRARAVELRDAETLAIKAFGEGTTEAAAAVALLAEEIDKTLSLQGIADVFHGLEAGIRNAVIGGIEAAIFNEDWKEALAAAFRDAARRGISQTLNAGFDALLGKNAAGNQQSLFGALFGGEGTTSTSPGQQGGSGNLGGMGYDAGGPPVAAKAPLSMEVAIFNVPDEATADAGAAKMSARGAAAIVAKGSGQPGVSVGSIRPGRRK